MIHEATIRLESVREGRWFTIDLRDLSAVRKATQAICDAPPDSRFKISATLPDWRLIERFDDRDVAVHRLEELRDYPVNLRPIPFSGHAVAVDSEPRSAIAEGFAELERCRFLIDGHGIKAMTDAGLWDRGFLLVANDRDGELRYVHVGRDLAGRLGQKRITQAIGQRFDHGFGTADRYYRMSCQQYLSAFHSGEPLRHHVDSLIPDRTGERAPARLNYDRLIIQVRLINGEHGLFITTQARSRLLPLAQAG